MKVTYRQKFGLVLSDDFPFILCRLLEHVFTKLILDKKSMDKHHTVQNIYTQYHTVHRS